MKDGYSCYYLCLVGTIPTEEQCRKFGGCKNCTYYLKDPEPKGDFDGQERRKDS